MVTSVQNAQVPSSKFKTMELANAMEMPLIWGLIIMDRVRAQMASTSLNGAARLAINSFQDVTNATRPLKTHI